MVATCVGHWPGAARVPDLPKRFGQAQWGDVATRTKMVWASRRKLTGFQRLFKDEERVVHLVFFYLKRDF